MRGLICSDSAFLYAIKRNAVMTRTECVLRPVVFSAGHSRQQNAVKADDAKTDTTQSKEKRSTACMNMKMQREAECRQALSRDTVAVTGGLLISACTAADVSGCQTMSGPAMDSGDANRNAETMGEKRNRQRLTKALNETTAPQGRVLTEQYF